MNFYKIACSVSALKTAHLILMLREFLSLASEMSHEQCNNLSLFILAFMVLDHL